MYKAAGYCVEMYFTEMVVDSDLLPDFALDPNVLGVFVHRGYSERSVTYLVMADCPF